MRSVTIKSILTKKNLTIRLFMNIFKWLELKLIFYLQLYLINICLRENTLNNFGGIK